MTEPKWEQPPEPIEPASREPRVWAEPDTTGEAYIPFTAGEQSRSGEIWREMADWPNHEWVTIMTPEPLRILGLKLQTFVLVVFIAFVTLFGAWLGWFFGGLPQ
jgi:hypothetical protein